MSDHLTPESRAEITETIRALRGGGVLTVRYDDEVGYGDTHMGGPFDGLVEAVDIVTYREGSRYVLNEAASRDLSKEAVEALIERGLLKRDES